MEAMPYDEHKLEELILYVATKTKDDVSFGATKLNKVLFYADFLHYAQTGTPITGAVYQKLRHGPAPRRLVPIRQHLIRSGAATRDRNNYLGRFRVDRLLAERGPDLSLFSTEELRFVDEVTAMIASGSALTISEQSHSEVGWQLANEGEEIPYFTVWLSFCPATEDDRLRAHELADKLLPV